MKMQIKPIAEKRAAECSFLCPHARNVKKNNKFVSESKSKISFFFTVRFPYRQQTKTFFVPSSPSCDSCLSAGLNSVSTLLMEDFLRDLGPFRHSSSPYASNFTLGSSSAHAAAAAAPAAPAAAATTRSSSPAAVDERRVQACRGATVALGILSSALACLIAARRQRGDDGFPELGWATLGAAAGPSLALFMLGFFTATANKMVSETRGKVSGVFFPFNSVLRHFIVIINSERGHQIYVHTLCNILSAPGKITKTQDFYPSP